MQSTVIHLIGKPGVGKYTTGLELARRTGARLVDNHSIAIPIFNAFGVDGVTPLPDAIWKQVSAVRAAVLETIRTLSAPEMSFIFTNFIAGEDAAEMAIFDEFVDLARVRGSLFVPVVLTCSVPDLLDRIVRDDRRERMKLVDPVLGASFATDVPEFRTDHPNGLVLDNSNRSAAESVTAILDWVEQRRRGVDGPA